MQRPLSLSALAITVALVAGACGGSESVNDGNPSTTSTTTAPGVVGTESTTSTTAPASTTTSTTTTTEPPPSGPTPLALGEIPELIAAWGDGNGDPLALAEQVVGFPIPIPVPEGTTANGVSVDLFGAEPAAPWEWDWTYEVLSPEPLPDIDIDLDNSGPGAVALRDRYDPIMADLGWAYSNSTGSDASSGAGGPQSINHVYQSNSETITVDGLAAEPNPAFVWADEEQVFGEGVPGYQIDVSLDFDAGVIPVPLIRAILDALPEVAGAQLVDAGVASRSRPEDSFDAAYGLRYLEVTVELTLPPGTTEIAQDTFSTGLGDTALGDTALRAGSESFFDPGFFEPEDPTMFGDDWMQSVVFLDRYEGSVTIGGPEPDETVEIRIILEPNRGVLQDQAE